MFEIFVDDIVAASTPGIAVAVRVHAGTVRVGDRVSRAVDAQGNSWTLDLEIRELALNENTPVDSLDENYGGLATLFGAYSSVRAGQTLSG